MWSRADTHGGVERVWVLRAACVRAWGDRTLVTLWGAVRPSIYCTLVKLNNQPACYYFSIVGLCDLFEADSVVRAFCIMCAHFFLPIQLNKLAVGISLAPMG